MDWTWADMQRQENGDPPAPLTFDGEFMAENFPHGPDDDDVAAMNLAMDRDMRDRDRFWERRARAAEEALMEAEARLEALDARPVDGEEHWV